MDRKRNVADFGRNFTDSTDKTKKMKLVPNCDQNLMVTKNSEWPKLQMGGTGRGEIETTSREQLVRQDVEVGGSGYNWSRAAPPDFNPEKDSILFQQTDIDYYIDTRLKDMPGPQDGLVPIVRIYGVTKEGNSVCCHIHGFTPYFYVTVHDTFKETHLNDFKEALTNAIFFSKISSRDSTPEPIHSLELLEKESMYGYNGNQTRKFLRIVVTLPSLVTKVQKLLERGDRLLTMYRTFEFQAYESNIPFETRFMADRNLDGCAWIRLHPHTYKLRPSVQYSTRCQIEVDVAYYDVVSYPPEGEWGSIAYVRILSFHIECLVRGGNLPRPEFDPVIQIASVVQSEGELEPLINTVFTLNTCDSIPGVQVQSFTSEVELLEAWSYFVHKVDPDVMTGYNINKVDLTYMLNRAKWVNAKHFNFLGRVLSGRTFVHDLPTSKTGAMNREIKIEGRIVFDMFQVLSNDYLLSSYKLTDVTLRFLDEKKGELHNSEILDLHTDNPTTRTQLAVYCLNEALIPLRIMNKLSCFINYVQVSRVTGVPLSWLLAADQPYYQIKTISQLLRKGKEYNMLIPTFESGKGANGNKKPKLNNLYDHKTMSYNCNMIVDHNICYTTRLSRENTTGLRPEDLTQTSGGSLYVKPSIHNGILPQMLEGFLNQYKNIEEELKIEKDMIKYKTMEARVRALKSTANCIYEFTQCGVVLPSLDITKVSEVPLVLEVPGCVLGNGGPSLAHMEANATSNYNQVEFVENAIDQSIDKVNNYHKESTNVSHVGMTPFQKEMLLLVKERHNKEMEKLNLEIEILKMNKQKLDFK